MKIFSYDPNTRVFTQSEEGLTDPLDGNLMLPSNATSTPLPNFNPEVQYLRWDGSAWVVHVKNPTGVFYKKTDGTPITIDTDQAYSWPAEEYVSLPPDLPMQKDTTIAFNSDTSAWEYVRVDISFLKENKIKELKQECNLYIRSYSGEPISQNRWLEKSQNFQDVRQTYIVETAAQVPLTFTEEEYGFAKGVLTRKDLLRARFREHKDTILSSEDKSFILNFDATDTKLWLVET